MIRGMRGRWSGLRRLRHRLITLPWSQLSAAAGRCGTLKHPEDQDENYE